MSVSTKGPLGVHVQRGNQQRRVKVLGADGEVKGEVPHHALVQALVEREGIASSLTPDALVEEELKAISVCEECRERPLSMTGRALEKRRHKERPWRCKHCATAERNRSLVADAATREAFRSKMREVRKAIMATKTPEELEEERRRLVEGMRARRAKLTPEEMEREAADIAAKVKAHWAKKSPEEMEEHRKRSLEARTPEGKRRVGEASRARWAAMTPEERSEQARQREAQRTPKQVSKAAARAENRRRKESEGT